MEKSHFLVWGSLLGCLLMAAAWAGEVKLESIEYERVKFLVVRLAPAELKLVWKGEDGKPMRSFDVVQRQFSQKGQKVLLLMNAGIYEPGGVPSGLHVEGGQELRPLNLKEGEGNFFLKPGGVFLISNEERAKVVKAESYPAAAQGVRLALQSGPALLLNGVRHPAFRQGSVNVKHRNGIGVDADGRVVLAMTDKKQEVNFWDFSGLFLKLGCKNALFLDGDISQMAVNPAVDLESNQFGAILVVAEELEGTQPPTEQLIELQPEP